MDPDFWHDRWQTGQLGFHQAEVNRHLVRHWPNLGLESERVLVPLCGKSLDMLWLHDRGHPVLGVEISPVAVRDFFEEAGISAQTRSEGAFEVTSGGGIRLLCGDFFDLTSRDLDAVHGVYDRAALVALPPEMRQRYAALLVERLPRPASMLLITFEYEQERMQGPPFAVSENEVHELFDAFSVELLERTEPASPPPRFQERGLDVIREAVYRLRARA